MVLYIYLLVLPHTPAERYIIGFSESTKWIKQQDRVFVTHLKESPSSIGHEKGVTIVYRVPKLERENGVCVTLRELLTKLRRRQTEPVETVVVLDRLQDL